MRKGFFTIVTLASLSTFFSNAHSSEIFPDPYQNLKFYYGDNHFHSGFSGDNVKDSHPLNAFIHAAARAKELGRDTKSGGDSSNELGGYFLFMSDHVHFIPTRSDMTNDTYQIMQQEAYDSRGEFSGPQYTFTVFTGGELTGLARNTSGAMPWDDKFGHLNIFNLQDITKFTENSIWSNIKGTDAMDFLTTEKDAIGQFNHSGFNGEPRTGDDSNSLYPYTTARDKVFNLFEVTDGIAENWEAGVAQFNICLRKGYHVSPVVGSDYHDTNIALPFRQTLQRKIARTVILAPSTLNLSVNERRRILLDSIRRGMVYASENLNLHLKVSINGFPIGHRFEFKPDELNITIDVNDVGTDAIQSVQLLQNQDCTDGSKVIDDKDVTSEAQCTRNIAKWDAGSTGTENIFSEHFSKFHVTLIKKTKSLPNLKYAYLKVIMKNGDRAITTPFFF